MNGLTPVGRSAPVRGHRRGGLAQRRSRRLKLSQPTMGRRLRAGGRMGAKLLERLGGGPGGSYAVRRPRAPSCCPWSSGWWKRARRSSARGPISPRTRPARSGRLRPDDHSLHRPPLAGIAGRAARHRDRAVQLLLPDQPVAARGGHCAAQPAAGRKGRLAMRALHNRAMPCSAPRRMSRGIRWRRQQPATRNAAGSASTTRAATARACCG